MANTSLGYAERLKPKRKLGGQLGADEFQEDVATVQQKADELAEWISQSKRVFVFTGAGISTACGIPDFRGPTGIWTLKKKKKPITGPMTPFEMARPSFTHMAISALVASGKVPYVCSQNVDSLHLRSGVPRHQLSELHGNCFAERCAKCKREYVRDFQIETVDFRATGRECVAVGCDGPLHDNVLDWESPLPVDEYEESISVAETSGVALVLGSSLQITPANEIPLYTPTNGGKMVIVNLQKTPRDRNAQMLLRARVDVIMARLIMRLGIPLPPFVRTDGVVVSHAVQQARAAAPGTATTASQQQDAQQPQQQQAGQPVQQQRSQSGGRGPSRTWSFTLSVTSLHGRACPLPMVDSVRLSFPDHPHLAQQCTVSGAPQQPEGQQQQGSEEQQPGEAQQQQRQGGQDAQEGAQGPLPNGSCSQAGGSGGEQAADAVQLGSPAVAMHEAAASQQTGAPAAAASSTAEPAASVACNGPHAGASGNHAAAVAVTCGGSAPFEFHISGLPTSLVRVRCSLELHLSQWADEDRRHVVLEDYHVMQTDPAAPPSDADVAATLDAAGLSPPIIRCHQQQGQQQQEQAPGQGQQQGQGQGQEAQGDAAAGAPTPAAASGPCFRVFTFVTQHVHSSAESVWQAFVDNPPPVKLPPVRPKKAKEEGDGDGQAGAQGGKRRRLPAASVSPEEAARQRAERYQRRRGGAPPEPASAVKSEDGEAEENVGVEAGLRDEWFGAGDEPVVKKEEGGEADADADFDDEH